MNVKLLTCVFVSIALAILSYLAIQFLAVDTSGVFFTPLAILVGGILTPLIASSLPSSSSVDADNNQSVNGDITTLYVGNLPYRANEDAVKAYFEDFTHVQSVRLMKDKRTGKRKGYGFVEIIASDVNKAIDTLNDSVFQDRTLKVRHAKEKVSHD